LAFIVRIYHDTRSSERQIDLVSLFPWYTSSLDTLMTNYFLKGVQLMVRSREGNNCGNCPYH